MNRPNWQLEKPYWSRVRWKRRLLSLDREKLTSILRKQNLVMKTNTMLRNHVLPKIGRRNASHLAHWAPQKLIAPVVTRSNTKQLPIWTFPPYRILLLAKHLRCRAKIIRILEEVILKKLKMSTILAWRVRLVVSKTLSRPRPLIVMVLWHILVTRVPLAPEYLNAPE